MNPSFTLSRDGQGRLVLHRPGQDDVTDVRIRTAFPWSAPGRYISIRSAEGKEILLIDDLNSLDPQVRQIIEASQVENVFIPKITHVENVDVRFGYQQWRVRTDRGPVEFRVQEREDIRFLPDGRFSIKDADGNVYELAGLDSLDASSRKAVEALL